MKTITLINKKIVLTLGLLLITFLGFSQSPQTFNSTGTWTCPAGVTSIDVEAWGAGGAGGGNTANTDGSGGGGGGAYSKSTIAVTPGTTYTVTVGTGGIGSFINGTAGGDSWFNTTGTLLAKGGNGGISGTLVSGAAGGNGGSAASGVGTTKFSGGNGGYGRNNNTGRGGPGGSSAGTAANGTSGPNPWSTLIAAAAPAGGGIGGNGGDSVNNGISAAAVGAGGGGSGDGNSSTDVIGGNGANGRVILTWSCSAAHILTAAATATGPICAGTTSVVTLSSSSMATGTYTVTYNLTGTNTATGTIATMNFIAGSPGTGTFTTSALANAGATTVTITSLVLGSGCSSAVSSNNTGSITVNNAATAVAGTAISTCTTAGAVNITAGSSATNNAGITWTSNGTGSFTSANSLTLCTYLPSAADILAGSRTLTLTATGNAPCANVISTKTITITTAPTAIAGTTITTCSSSGAVNITAGSSATNQTSVTWTSSGTGTFTNATSLTACTYNPSATDITAGNVILTLTAVNAGCANATSTKNLTINSVPTAVAGTAINTCTTSGAVNITAGSSATNFSSILWTSSGSGTFTNANSLTACTYNPSVLDILAGSVTLTLRANGNSPCGNVTSTKSFTFRSPMTVNAGLPVTTCSTSGAVNVTDFTTTATNQTSVTWTSNGSGTFSNANSLTTCTYTPSAADITAGSVLITLTASNGGCADVSSSKNLTINTTPTITGTTPATRVGTGTVTLGATASAGTISWYANATGGSALGFGTSFTTPSISTTTTYYVESVNGTCTSTPRIAVIATVIFPEIDIQGNATSIPDGDTTATTADWTDFSTTATTRTFTILNSGTAPLTVGAITFSGTNASDFSVINTPSASVAPSASTTFTVRFTPSATGTRTAIINIANDDNNENPYDFALRGTGLAQEIDIQGNATSIVDGDTTPATTDWTNFGTTDISAGSITRTFTVLNSGTMNLTLGAITFSGAGASDFSASTPDSSTVNGLSFVTFTVTFNPSVSGTRTASLSIVNNDSNENPYDFTLQGIGVEPEIDITGNAISIVDGDTTPSITDWTDFGSTDVNTGGIAKTFTIKNTGNSILNIGAITFTGIAANDFNVTTTPSSAVGIGGSTIVVIRFTPSAIGTRTATINIANDDNNENPYDFALQGFGTNQEIDIQGNSTSIIDGDTTPSTTDWTDFSTVTNTRTFTIRNTGTSPLNIGTITFSGVNAGDFSIATAPSPTINVGATTTFSVLFSPAGAGTRTATMSIVNDDNDENPYDFALQGTAVNAEINIQGNGVTIVDGDTTPTTADWTDFSTVATTRTFTIQNTGTVTLTIGAITFSGTNASEFTVLTAPSASIPAYGTSTFDVRFTTTATGNRTATMSIVNSDSNENPYDFALQANGVPQEINVQGNATSIVTGDTTPVTTDWTDFSTVATTRTFTIQNTGTINLNIGTITIGGTNPGDFSITTLPSTIVAGTSSSTFVVTFNPTTTGVRNATISIPNNDTTGGENPYTFAIRGTGVAQEIDIKGNATSIADGDTTPTTTDWTDFGSVTASSGLITRTFTIENLGSMNLTAGSVIISGTNAADFSVTTSPSTNVAGLGSTTFVVSFDPNVIGLRTARLTIANNDSNENPYDFSIQGTGIEPEINVQGNSVSIVSGDNSPTTADWTDFSNVTLTRTYTIQNLGASPLSIGTIAFAGPHASEFTVTTLPVSSVAAGGSTTFVVTFTPLEIGVRTATVFIENNDSNENPYTFGIIATGVNIDTDGDGINNSVDTDDDNDGITDVIECGTCLTDPFVNGGFETSSPLLPASSYAFYPAANVAGWQSSPENIIELWSSGFNGVTSASGNQFAELNANVAGTLYQTFCLNGASGTITWSIKHRARSGTDQAFVRFGSTLLEAQTNTPIVTMVDGTSAWGLYSGTYIIPAGQTQIVLAFQAGYTGSGNASVGNFIDDVQITINQACIDTDSDGIANLVDLDDENDGIPDVEESGFKIYSNNTSTFDKTSITYWKDTNGNGMNDYIDALISAGTYVIPDTDGDGIPNYLDLDSDNDTFFDVDEAGLFNGDGDINGDGRGDLLDSDRDGILDLYDNSTVYGTTTRAFAQDSDSNGISDYLQLDSNSDGIYDIKTGLYGSFDANNDGIIDGSGDIDKDGITDTFDTNNTVTGSPRDLNRKLFLDFDGRNDYGQDSAVLGGLANASLMAWINLKSVFNSTGVVVGQNKFQIRITSAKRLEVVLNSTTLTYATPLSESQWTHVGATYDGTTLKLFLNGLEVTSVPATGNINTDISPLTLGKNPLGLSNFFKGKIDEVRVFNVALTNQQFQRMVYQEIQNTSSQVRGAIVPKDIESLPFANVLRYYRMDAYKDDIVDNLTTSTIDVGTGMKIYNHKIIKVQEAPMPFITERAGSFATAVNSPTKEIRGLDITDYDYSIVQVRHNITEPANNTSLGMFIDSGVTVVMNNDNKLQNDWYLKLDGKIDLQGKSQLVQTINSDLDVTSAGSIERDQQGQSIKYNYNYWSSPVGGISTTSNNNSYTVDNVMKDGTDPANIKNINWVAGYDGAATSPITLSNYWIYKFQNVSAIYANWAKVGQTGTLYAGQGFTLKGSGAASANQNYTFVGKPNSGSISSPIAANNSNLSGNPYPSAIDSYAFIDDNIASTTGTLYFWEHYSTNSSHVLAAYQGGYATLTKTGTTPPAAPAGISSAGSSSKRPGRYIPVGQGFFVNGSATGGTITFKNSQRAFIKENDAVNSNVLFRNNANNGPAVQNLINKQDAVPQETDFSKIRLGFKSTNGDHRQLLIGFMNEHATSAVDPGYDGIQLDSQPNDMYFMNTNTKLTIQGDTYFNTDGVFPLGVKTAIEGKVKLNIDALENFDENQAIYIFDNVTNLYHDIRNEAFEVNLTAGTLNERFSLRFKNPTALAVNNFDAKENIKVAFSSNNNTINVKNNLLDTTVKSVTLFNILGQSLSSWNVKNDVQTNIQIPVKNLSTGTYIVKLQTTNGDISKKIIIQ